MRRSRFTEEQIIGMIREQVAGTPTADVCHKHGISTVSFYKCKAKYGDIDVSGSTGNKTPVEFMKSIEANCHPMG